MKKTILAKYLFVVSGLLALFSSSCNKDWKPELEGEAPRLFRPLIKGSLKAPGNYIDVVWQKSNETNKYKIELSVDSFKTVSNTLDATDTTAATLNDLLWEQLYQVRVTALHPANPAKNSRPADFGEIKTPRFPTIVESPLSSDIGWTTLLFKWRNEGEPVTSVKILNPATSELVSTVSLTQTDVSNMYLLIRDLKEATPYRVELYSKNVFRGGNDYTTKEKITGEVIDLQDTDPATVDLSAVVNNAIAGTTIILKRGGSYEVLTALNISKPITIMSGVNQLVTEKARIGITGISNLNIAAGANITKAAFIDLEIYSNDVTGKYVFNPSGTTANIDELLFDNCIIRDFRGVARFRGAITIAQLTLENCIVSNIGGYGLTTVDDAVSSIKNITLHHSTFNKVEKLIVSKNNMEGKIAINGNTFYATVLAGAYLIDFNGSTLLPKGGIEFLSNILGRAKGSATTPPAYDIYGFRVNAGTVITSSLNYATSDFIWKANASVINPNATAYNKTSADVFVSPETGNFTIKDNGFPGKETAGDPRWRP